MIFWAQAHSKRALSKTQSGFAKMSSAIAPQLPSGPAIGGGQATPPGSPRMSSAPMPRTNAFPDPGNFGPHPDRVMLKNMYDAITQLDLWPWLQRFTPEEGKGFMFSSAKEIRDIAMATDEMGHSGASFAICMRNMEVIAKKGWISYYQEYIAPHFLRPLH